MKKVILSGLVFTAITIMSLDVNGQISIKKPNINLNGKNVKASDVGLGGKDASGLFKNVTKDPSADSHRRIAVENLEKMEAMYNSPSIDYKELSQIIMLTEKEIGMIMKLEPKIDAEKFNERYTPVKEKATAELAIYDQVVALEKAMRNDYSARIEAKNYDVITFRTDNYGAKNCYCRDNKSATKTYAEYEKDKKEYESLTAKLVGYKNDDTQKLFANNVTCVKNGNAYALWASKESLEKEITAYNATELDLNPDKVIKRCDSYTKGLENIETDYSLNLDAASKTALKSAKETVGKVKKDAELYVSSGKYQAHLDKVLKEKLAKVFLPKTTVKNASLEAGAIAYVKGAEYADYIKNRTDYSPVASTFKAITLTKEPYVKKNEYGIPLWQYHELWVSFKGQDGKCYMAAVYASYTYKGAGTYATTPTWGADRPEQMACENVNK